MRLTMFAFAFPLDQEEEYLARVTDIAYQAVLHAGLPRSFVEVELELWRQIRAAYHAQEVNASILEDDYLAHVTEITRQAVLRFGSRRSPVIDESDLGEKIRTAYEALTTRDRILTEVA